MPFIKPSARARHVSGISFKGVRMLTEQSHKESCDMRFIMRKYEKEGIVQHVSKYKGTYGDFVNQPDFQTAMNIIAEASSMFETVPSRIRAQFYNDPGRFLEFVQDPRNIDAMKKMGLDTSHFVQIKEGEPGFVPPKTPGVSQAPADPAAPAARSPKAKAAKPAPASGDDEG